MEPLVIVPFSRFMFWRTIRPISLKQSLCQKGRLFSNFKGVQQNFQVCSTGFLVSKKQIIIHLEKWFSTKVGNPGALMDFDVWLYPKLFIIPRDMFYFIFRKKDFDSSSVLGFVECSTKALQVVTRLLSERRYSELEDLLTPECKAEVTRKVLSWTVPEVSVLSFQEEDIIFKCACDAVIFSDEKNKEKEFVGLRAIHYVMLEYNDKFFESEIVNFFSKHGGPPLQMLAVFNCRFIKEITKGITGHWIISKINLRCFPVTNFSM